MSDFKYCITWYTRQYEDKTEHNVKLFFDHEKKKMEKFFAESRADCNKWQVRMWTLTKGMGDNP